MTAVLMGDKAQAWVKQAACRGVPLDLFFDPSTEEEALTYCKRCPVRDECLADAMQEEGSAQGGRHGVRGNTTAQERGRLQRQRGRVR